MQSIPGSTPGKFGTRFGFKPLAALTGLAALTLGFTLAACAGSRDGKGSPCLDKCTNRSLTSLERSTCELECNQAANPPPAPVATVQPTPAPETAPAVTTASPPQPAQPASTGPRYAGDTAPRQATGPAPVVRPNPTGTPSTPAGPSMAELQSQRAGCESTCDANNARPSDRSTCRLQCAQITDRPASSPPPSGGAYVNPPTTAPTQGGTQKAPVDRAAVSACEANCNSESTPATDRATCKLNCNAVGSVGPAPSSYYVLQGGPPAGTNRADVIRSSGGVASTGNPPATTADPQRTAMCASQAQTCTTTCGTKQEPCNRGCDEGKLSATDRATCKLTCESNIDVCRDDCRIQEGTCRGPTRR